MRALDHYVLPLGLLVAAIVGAFFADSAAGFRRRESGGDRGDFWARVVYRICLFGVLVLLSEALAVVPQLSGKHLLFDLTTVAGWSFATSYRLALLIPFCVWAALLLFGLAEKPGDRDAGRWLAGALGGDSRHWILIWALPLAAILAATLTDLGGGLLAYPAAVWGTLAVLMVSLAGVAFSRGGEMRVAAVAATQTATAKRLQPWPEALRARGVRLRELVSWPQGPTTRDVKPSARDLAERLHLRGARGVAPELIEAVDKLFSPALTNEQRHRLVSGPDGAGQLEVVALAAELLDQRFHATTLVVTASGAEKLARDLRFWLPSDRNAVAFTPSVEITSDVAIVVADAQTLSDQLLQHLKDPQLLRRFGLIVWWQLEAYTGVFAANLWAISRRLHRLLRVSGRQDMRTMAFVRLPEHPDAQTERFVRMLLPHAFPRDSRDPVELRFPRTVQLHLLESHQEHFSGTGEFIHTRTRHVPFTATKISIEAGWLTSLDVPADVTAPEADVFLRSTVGSGVVADTLQTSVATAGAHVLRIEAADVLSLVEIISQGGRAAPPEIPHHVGITLPWNPYVAHILSKLERGGRFPMSRRLVSAAAHPSVIQRHLLLALHEMPDTESGLLKDFLWSKEIIRNTLEKISGEGYLTRKEVRFLDDILDLQREEEYKSQQPPRNERRPLDTVGEALIEVRDPSAGQEFDGGVQMRVDRDRLTIQAYPGRVFMCRGQRYRIEGWNSIDEVLREGSLSCAREQRYCATWRVHDSKVFRIETDGPAVALGTLARFAASLTYEEEFLATLTLEPNLLTGEVPDSIPQKLALPFSQKFETRAVVLTFPKEQDSAALVSLAHTLRHVLPVHVGVEEDALEVVPLQGDVMVQKRRAYGLAIVDLYPGGIGLVDAISSDNALLTQLFQAAEDWLKNCPCQSDGCPRCLHSPSSRTIMTNRPPSRKAALELLHQVV